MDHLFFKCDFIILIWKELLRLCLQVHVVQSWNVFIEDKARLWKKDNMKSILSKMSFEVVVYHIWMVRNNICFGKGKMTEVGTLATIKTFVREKATLLKNVEAFGENLSIPKIGIS